MSALEGLPGYERMRRVPYVVDTPSQRALEMACLVIEAGAWMPLPTRIVGGWDEAADPRGLSPRAKARRKAQRRARRITRIHA